jgi:nucleoid DNA-binding protein
MDPVNDKQIKEDYLSITSIKDHLVKKVSQEQQIPLHIVRAVIDNQFKTAEQAIGNVNSIEIAGFGRFMLSERRTLMRIKRYGQGIDNYRKMLVDPEANLTQMRRDGIVVRLEELEKSIIYLTEKADAFHKTK